MATFLSSESSFLFMTSTLLLAVITALANPTSQAQFYITPSHNTTCPGFPCLTLSQYAAQARNSTATNTVVLFLPGNHTLNTGIPIRNSLTFHMSGNSSSLPSLQSVIICEGLAGFEFENVTLTYIFALAFTGCGAEHPNMPITVFFYVAHVHFFSVRSCSFFDNGFIRVFHIGRSTQVVEISDCSFKNNRARVGSIVGTFGSTVLLSGTNCFVNNSATKICSVIYSLRSTMIFNSSEGTPAYYKNDEKRCESGSVTFLDNYVKVEGERLCCGGAVCVYHSTLKVFGKSRWEHNFFRDPPPDELVAFPYFGGALFVDFSNLSLEGDHLFTNNIASVGGAIYVRFALMFSTRGSLRLVNNIAHYAAALYASGSIYEGEGLMLFANNSQDGPVGGCVFFTNSRVHFRDGIHLQNNTALFGALHVSHSSLLVEGSAMFMSNRAQAGAALYVDVSKARLVGNISFTNNVASLLTAIHTYQSDVEIIENFTLINNHGGGLLAGQSSVRVNGTVLVRNNSAFFTGGGIRLLDSNISLRGSLRLENNRAQVGGGALEAYNSTVELGAVNISFTNNSAPQGGGLFLQALSKLIFNPPLQMYARHNMADRGAAIFVEDVITFNFCSPNNDPAFPLQEQKFECFFTSSHYSSKSSANLVFEDNIANIAGTTLYGGMLERCLLVNAQTENANALEKFNSISTILQAENDTTSVISSDPFQLCLCVNQTANCITRSTEVYVRRGQVLIIHAVAVGQANGSVPTVVRAQFPTITFSESFFGESEDIQLSGKVCTEYPYTIFSPSDSVEFIMYADGPCRDLGDSSLTIRVHLLPCPIGFQLSGATCACHPTIQPYTNSCTAADGTIERGSSGNFWIGVLYRNSSYWGLIVHPNCPFDYCRNERIFINLNNSDSQCSFHRTGILCGSCADGLSLALGSSNCLQCSSAFVTLLMPIALAGVVLIIFLLLLRLTVAVGTINGLIFYANVLAVNSSVFFPNGNTFSISKLFISWLNLDLGITTCFYDGMDAYARVWFQFIFPAYVWLMMGVVITTSHYSSRAARLFGRNPVAVLSTLFLLSYAKMLRTIIAVLSFTFIQYPDGHHEAVWLYDGNVQYLQGKHIPLFLVALAFLLVLFIPYTLYLIFGQCILSRSKTWPFSWLSSLKLRPFLDAYHSPFSTRHRYWLGLLLLLRCALFLVTAFNTSGDASVDLLAISSSLLGLLALRWLNGLVYKLWYLDALELSFILNLGVLSAGTYHILLTGGNQTAIVSVSVGTAFATFSGIVFFHVYKGVKDSCACKKLYDYVRHFQFKSSVPREEVNIPNPPQSEITSEVVVPTTVFPAPPQYKSFFELRESLLETN